MITPSRWIQELQEILASDEDDHGVGNSAAIKAFTLLTLSTAAMRYLFVEGFLAAGSSLSGPIVWLVGIAFFIETLPDIWLYRGPLQQNHPKAKKLVETHYIIEAISYILLLAAVFNLFPYPQFYVYSAFLLLWIFSFLVGEAVVIFLDQP
jgi:membrane protein YdbS with pleckstrin-like domain